MFYYLSAFKVYMEPTSAAIDFCNDFIASYNSRDFDVWPQTKYVLKTYFFAPSGAVIHGASTVNFHDGIGNNTNNFAITAMNLIPFWGFGGFNPDKPQYYIKTLVKDDSLRRALSGVYTSGPYTGLTYWQIPTFEYYTLYMLTDYVMLSTLYSIASDGSDFLPASAIPS